MIGREYEIERLTESLKSNSSELIAVYGRRRVGKTFLIRNVYEKQIKFEVTGLYGGKKENQLDIFFEELKKVSKKLQEQDKPSNWKVAFELLKNYITGLRGGKSNIH